MTCSQAKSALRLEGSVTTIWRAIKSDSYLKYRKPLRKPKLSQLHKQRRMEFAEKYVDFGDKWLHVIFSDEKRFNLNGPDGLHSYWHDLRREPDIMPKRQNGGGGMMVWATTGYNGTTNLVFIERTMKSADYQDVLALNLLLDAADLAGEDWIFGQDNAPPRTSKPTKAFFESNSVKLLDWPARSPHLNIIENVWGCLAQAVYRNGRQFESAAELRKAIEKEWDSMDHSLIHRLYDSIKSRLVEVIKKKGGNIHY